jgi:hypothetical protein
MRRFYAWLLNWPRRQGTSACRQRGVLLGMYFLAIAQTARAADPVNVTMTAAGPDREIPVGSPFYLQGQVDGAVTEVRPVFVRVGTQTIVGSNTPNCSKFFVTVGEFIDSDGKASKVLTTSLVGKSSASSLWKPKTVSGSVDNNDIFIVAPWTKPKKEPSAAPATPPAASSETEGDAKQSYKLLVPSDDFFSSAGMYCLVVYETTKKDTDVTAKVQAAVASFVKTVDDDRCGLDQICLRKAEQDRDGALAELNLPGDTFKRLQSSIAQAFSSISSVLDKNQEVARQVKALKGATENPIAFDTEVPLQDANAPIVVDKCPPAAGQSLDALCLNAASLHLARATLSLLVQHNAVLPVVTTKNAHSLVQYYSMAGKIPVNFLRVAADASTITYRSTIASVDQDAQKVAEVNADALTFGAENVSLRDLLELARGRIRLESSADFQQLNALAVLTPRSDPLVALDPKENEQYASVARRLHALASVLERATKIDASETEANHADLGTERASLREASRWFDVAAPSLNSDGVSALAQALDAYTSNVAAWQVDKTALNTTVSTTETHGATVASGVKVSFTQSTWVFTYATPVIGQAFLRSRGDGFSTPYVAIQLHAVPNPVDEPLWSHGLSDFARAFALELRMATGNGPWGPDNRFSGWHGLPPLAGGVAFHLIPYTSLTVGGAVLQRRSSTVTQQRPELYGCAYIGVNVQINIPDLIAGLKGRHSATASEK